MQRTFFNFILAIEGVLANKLRTILTGLGIMFGVGAVIAMLAIGTGAKQAILEQMKLIGTNNIVVNGVVSSEENEEEDSGGESGNAQEDKTPWSPGLTVNDAQSIAALIPTIEQISPEIVLPVSALKAGKMIKTRCVGVSNAFFNLNNFEIEIGNFFHQSHLTGGKSVCIIGKNISTRLFSDANPIGKTIKCGNVWLEVIGVLEGKSASKESLQNLGIRNYNNDIYIPVSTALLRFKNRAYIGKDDIQRGRGDDDNYERSKNYHQLDRLVIQVNNPENLRATADVVFRMLKRRHKELVDFELEIPELLLEQQQKTQETFNLVLAVIAGISLLVGGIGIMNIMLASVLERIKEIGVRRSLGATKSDIIWQFLFEAIFISLLGGLIGVFIGVLAAEAIASSADIPTIVSGWSVFLSFGVAATVGLVFGIFPAQKAARQDPIKALRTD